MKCSLVFSLTNSTGFFKQICLSSVLKKINNIFQSVLNCAITLRTFNSIIEIFATSLSNMNMRLVLWQELWYNSHHNKQFSISHLFLYGKCW